MVLRCPVDLTVAGRTDAGVHATGQVAHCDVPRELVGGAGHPARPPAARGAAARHRRRPPWRRRPPEFDARFSALARHYVYRLTDAAYGPPPLRRADTVGWPRTLDADAMARGRRAAARRARLRRLLPPPRGRHDHPDAARARRRARRRPGHDRAPRPTPSATRWSAASSARCSPSGRAAGRRSGRPRCSPAPSGPARCRWRPAGGLTLVRVDYPPDDELAARALVTRARRGLSHAEARPRRPRPASSR